MRVPAALLVLILSVPAMAADDGSGFQIRVAPGAATRTVANSPLRCPQTTGHLAVDKDLYRGHKLTPRKLTELPPGTTYMAVFRHIGGCEAPLTMVDYRNPRRR